MKAQVCLSKCDILQEEFIITPNVGSSLVRQARKTD